MKFKSPVLLGLFCLLTLSGTCSVAQSDNGLDTPWIEEAVPAPSVFATDHLIPIDMPRYVSVQVGVDPQSIVVSSDGVVRYIMVMRNATGSTSAVYEGIRCASDEVKTYARYSASGQWSMVANPEWKAINDNMPSRHAQAFARQGGCQDHLAPTKQEILDVLKTPRRSSLNKAY